MIIISENSYCEEDNYSIGEVMFWIRELTIHSRNLFFIKKLHPLQKSLLNQRFMHFVNLFWIKRFIHWRNLSWIKRFMHSRNFFWIKMCFIHWRHHLLCWISLYCYSNMSSSKNKIHSRKLVWIRRWLRNLFGTKSLFTHEISPNLNDSFTQEIPY